jgi:hypothetical protein
MILESDGGMILTGENRRTQRKTCPSATSSTTNPTWTDPGANPGLRGERPATNDLNHDTALLRSCRIGSSRAMAQVVSHRPLTAVAQGSVHVGCVMDSDNDKI